MSPSSPSSFFLPESQSVERPAGPPARQEKNSPVPGEQSFSRVMEKAAASSDAVETREDTSPGKAPGQPNSEAIRRRSFGTSAKPTREASAQTSNAQDSTLVVRTGSPAKSTPQEVSDEGSDTETEAQTAESTTEDAPAKLDNVVVLALPMATIIPLPLTQEVRLGAVTGTGVAPVIPTQGEAENQQGSDSAPAASDTGTEATATESQTPSDEQKAAIDVRRLGLRPIGSREAMALNLRAAISRLDDEAGNAPAQTATTQATPKESDAETKIIPFPSQGREGTTTEKIVAVDFGPTKGGKSENSSRATHVKGSEQPAEDGAESLERLLPGASGDTENSAGFTTQNAKDGARPPTPGKPDKTNAEALFHWHNEAPGPMNSRHGTSAARRERNMDSRSAQFDPAGEVGASSEISPSESAGIPAPTTDGRVRLASAADWTPSSHWNVIDSDVLDVGATATTKATSAEAVERVSKLIGRETVLFRQHASDSMAVVLRPDANTELFLHLSRRDGQIEASVRCERGDFNQLNAMWSQLQEALAQQKVRLNPLQESSNDMGSFYRNPDGSASQNRDESSRHSHPGGEFMDEWPAPASPEQVPAHVRSRRESGHRLSTSRPGWETWA